MDYSCFDGVQMSKLIKISNGGLDLHDWYKAMPPHMHTLVRRISDNIANNLIVMRAKATNATVSLFIMKFKTEWKYLESIHGNWLYDVNAVIDYGNDQELTFNKLFKGKHDYIV